MNSRYLKPALLLSLWLCHGPAFCQDISGRLDSGPLVATGLVGIDVTGRVVNAIDGKPVPRVLVNLDSRTVLTDALGRFTFSQFRPDGGSSSNSTAHGYVKLMKPGYSPALDAADLNLPQFVSNFSGVIELMLYPDAVISGTVTALDSKPIVRAQITVYRATADQIPQRELPAASVLTDSKGSWRVGVGGGRYSVEVRYGRSEGEVVLPQRYPGGYGSETSTTFPLNPGDQRRVDLHVNTGIARAVVMQADVDKNLRFMVREGNGPRFTVGGRPTGVPGEVQIELPDGTYEIEAVQQTRTARMEAQAHVTVAGRPVGGIALHFAEVPSIPIEVAVDAAATSTASVAQTASLPLVTAQMLNLRLEKEGPVPDDFSSQVRPTQAVEGSFVMQAGTGSYRLAGQANGQWYVERATYGSTDLLTQALRVTAGSAGEPIRVLVGNDFGQLSGTVRRAGVGVMGYVYLFPHEPSLVPFYLAQSALDGTYGMRLPPGTYTAVAFEHRFAGDLRDAATVGGLTGTVATGVAAGGKAVLDLEVQGQDRVR